MLRALADRELFRDVYRRSRDPIAQDRLLWRAQTMRHVVHLLPGQTILELGAGDIVWLRWRKGSRNAGAGPEKRGGEEDAGRRPAVGGRSRQQVAGQSAFNSEAYLTRHHHTRARQAEEHHEERRGGREKSINN